MPDAATLLTQFQPKESKVLKPNRQVCSVRYSPCGKLLAAGGFDSLIRRWNTESEELAELPSLAGHHGWVQEIAFSPAGGLMYSADSWGELKAWAYAESTDQPRWSVPNAHNGWIHGLAVSADGSLLATCGLDRVVRTWSAADGAKRQEFPAQPDSIQCVAFHPDGKSVLCGDLKGIIRQWDLATGQCARQFNAGVLFKEDRLQETGGVRCLPVSADGTMLACGGTKPANGGNVQGVPCLLVFDWASGDLKHTLDLGTANDVYVTDIRFHTAGFLMITTSGGPGAGKLIFRVPSEPKAFFETTAMPNCHALAVHPSGRRLAVAGTNGGSNGNGRNLDANGQYPDNFSPIYILDLPAVA